VRFFNGIVELYGKIAVLGCLSQPDAHLRALSIDVAHLPDLIFSFGPIILADADGVDPKQSRLRGRAKMP
jgi:hypothetical protein